MIMSQFPHSLLLFISCGSIIEQREFSTQEKRGMQRYDKNARWWNIKRRVKYRNNQTCSWSKTANNRYVNQRAIERSRPVDNKPLGEGLKGIYHKEKGISERGWCCVVRIIVAKRNGEDKQYGRLERDNAHWPTENVCGKRTSSPHIES